MEKSENVEKKESENVEKNENIKTEEESSILSESSDDEYESIEDLSELSESTDYEREIEVQTENESKCATIKIVSRNSDEICKYVDIINQIERTVTSYQEKLS